MRSLDLKKQASEFRERKPFDPVDPPASTQKVSESSKPKPVSQVNSYNSTIERVRAQYGKTHTVKSRSDRYWGPGERSGNSSGKLGDLTLTSKKTGYSVTMTPETNEQRANREYQAKNPKKRQSTKAIVPKAKGVQKVEQKTSSFTIKKGKQLDMDTRKAVAAGKKVNRINEYKNKKEAVAKSNASKKAAFEAKQTAKIAKRVEAKRLAKKNKKK
jgi:hypothetical protein